MIFSNIDYYGIDRIVHFSETTTNNKMMKSPNVDLILQVCNPKTMLYFTFLFLSLSRECTTNSLRGAARMDDLQKELGLIIVSDGF